MSRELFVYWHVDSADAAAAIAATHGFQAALRARFPALNARLYKRSEERDGRVTVMEVYAGAPAMLPGIDEAIATAASKALATWLRGPRHVETFVALPS